MKINGNPLFGILIELDSIERRIKKIKDKVAKIIIEQSKSTTNNKNVNNTKDAN